MTGNTIAGPNPTVTQVAPVAANNGSETTNPPISPLQSPNKGIRAAWQCALETIRQRNIAARNNGGQRVPLA
jgi:hypothetical protein